MKNENTHLWHIGFFFWVFGFGIYSLPSFADITEYEMGQTAFEYLITHAEGQEKQQKLLQYGMQITKNISLPSNDTMPAMYLYSQNRLFLLEKNSTDSIPHFSDDIKIQKDAEFFIKIDVWAYLTGFDDRERGTNQYIEWGKTLLSAMAHNETQKDEQIKEIKALISEQKKILSQKSEIYSTAITDGDSVNIEKYKAEKASISYEISILESRLEEISKRTKAVNTLKKTIEQKVLGAEENKDALIKNVKVKSPSGSYIKAIETPSKK